MCALLETARGGLSAFTTLPFVMPRLTPDQRLVCEGRKGINRKGWRGKEGKDSEERIARKGWRGKDGDESICFKKGWRGKEGKDSE